jgi:hypothetical protein
MPAIGDYPKLNAADGINASLLGFWPLSDNGGGLATDLGPFARRGVTVNGPTWVASSCGRVANFVRTSTQYISVGTDLGITSVANIAVSALAYRASSSDHGAIFKLGNNTDGTGGDGFAFGTGGSELENAGDQLLVLGEGNIWWRTGVTVPAGWVHWFVRFNDATQPVVYLNGVLVYTGSTGSVANVGSRGASIAQIGGYNGTPSANRYFTGQIAAVRVWSRAPLLADIAKSSTDRWAGVAFRQRRLVRAGATALTLAIDPQAYEYAASDVGLSSARRIVADPLAYQYAPQDVGLSYRQGAHTLDVSALAYGYRPASVDLTFSGAVQPVGAASRTRRGARRVYLPEPQATAVFHPNALPEELAAHAVKAWQDDEGDEWFLLA